MESEALKNIMKKLCLGTIFLFFVFVLSPFCAFCAETSAVVTKNVEASEPVFSMNDCIDYALKHDPNIKIYQDSQKTQKSLVGQAQSAYFPNLVGGTGYNINNTNYSGSQNNTLTNNYYKLNLGVNQLIWDFGRTSANINMNKFNYEAAGYNLNYQILNTIYNVKIAYTGVLAARANEDIYQRSVKINQLNFERANALYAEGLKSRIDVVNAEVYLTNAKIDFLEAQNAYQTALIALNKSMYYTEAPYTIQNTESFNFQKDYAAKSEINVSYEQKKIEDEIRDGAILTSGIEKRDIVKDYKFRAFDLSMMDAINKAYQNRPDLQSLELVKRASEESLKAVKKAYMPSVNASGGYSYQKNSDFASNALGIYAGIDLPTVNAMSIKYKIDQGKSYWDIAVQNIDLSKKNIYFEVQNYYVNMKQLEKRIPLMSQKIGQTLENFELADGRYTVGLGNFIELQQAQTNYNNAQLAFVQSVFNYNKARFYLEKAMGVNDYAPVVTPTPTFKSKSKSKPIIKKGSKQK